MINLLLKNKFVMKDQGRDMVRYPLSKKKKFVKNNCKIIRDKAVGEIVGPPFQPMMGKFAGSFAATTLIAIFLIVISSL